MSSCGGLYETVTRTPVTPTSNRMIERTFVDDKVTPSRKSRAPVDQKLYKVLDHLKTQQEENSKLREALTELDEKVTELQAKSSFADSSNFARRVPPGLSVSSFISVTGFQFYCCRWK